MAEKKTFPNQETPPTAEVTSNAPSPLDVMEAPPPDELNTENQPTLDAQSPAPQTVAPPVPAVLNLPKKKNLGKMLALVLGGLFLVVIIIFAIKFFTTSRPAELVGTKGELVWWGFHDDENVYRSIIDEYQNQNPNVKITYLKQSEIDYRERLVNALAAGKGPDIFEIHNSWKLMLAGELYPAPDNVLKKDDFEKSFYPVMTKDLTTTSGVIALPLEYDALTLYINDDLFTTALKSIPVTWDELQETAQIMTQKDSNKIILQSGAALGLTKNVDHWQEIVALMLIQNGVDFSKFPEETTSDAILFYSGFYKTDRVWDSALPKSTDAFINGKTAMYFGTTLRAREISAKNAGLRYRTVPLPQLQKQRPSDPDISYASYWAQSVSAKSVNSGIAWDFLKYISSPTNLQKMNELRESAGTLPRAYPRPDMAVLQKDDKILGSILVLAPNAKSWYLADETHDGNTGINSKMGKVFEELIETTISGNFKDTVKKLPADVSLVFSSFSTPGK